MLCNQGLTPNSCLAVAAAAFTAFSRWYGNYHWICDLAGGALAGSLAGASTYLLGRAIESYFFSPQLN